MWTVIVASVLMFCLVISLGIHCKSRYKVHRQLSDDLQIKNGLIVSIAIGKYEHKDWTNLPVERDVEHVKKLAKFLNFEFLNVPKSYGGLSWTKKEIFRFLGEDVAQACFDEKEQAKYDGIIVFISGHGMRHSIISSDLEVVDRTAIHRSISDKFPKIREIPRIFLFDACSGSRDRHVSLVNETVQKAVALQTTGPDTVEVLQMCQHV